MAESEQMNADPTDDDNKEDGEEDKSITESENTAAETMDGFIERVLASVRKDSLGEAVSRGDFEAAVLTIAGEAGKPRDQDLRSRGFELYALPDTFARSRDYKRAIALALLHLRHRPPRDDPGAVSACARKISSYARRMIRESATEEDFVRDHVAPVLAGLKRLAAGDHEHGAWCSYYAALCHFYLGEIAAFCRCLEAAIAALERRAGERCDDMPVYRVMTSQRREFGGGSGVRSGRT